MDRLIVFVIAGIGGLLLTAMVLVYFNPAIMSMTASQEGESQDVFIGDEVSAGSNGYQQLNITVNGQVILADISATTEQKTKGLTVKDALAENEAMLFVFGNEAEHRFWMKDMKFPIDIIWISRDKTVVHIEHKLQPCSLGMLCPMYKPAEDNSMYVLETVGGFAEKYGVMKGSKVNFDLNV